MPLAAEDLPKRYALRLRLERQGGLPVRPSTVRSALRAYLDPSTDDSARPVLAASVDPGWMIGILASKPAPDHRTLIASNPWWPVAPSRPAHKARETVWLHAVAMSRAAERLARDAGHPDPAWLADIALLAPLGLLAIAAAAPEHLAAWLAIKDPARRREAERSVLRTDASAFGRDLAEAWGLPELVADAAWLHADSAGDWAEATNDPQGLKLLREARTWADRTPWALDPHARRSSVARKPHGDEIEPLQIRQLVAEVQSLCIGGLRATDATEYEERLARSHAKLLLERDELQSSCAAKDRVFLDIAAHVTGAAAETGIDLPVGPAGTAARSASEAVVEACRRRDRLGERLELITESYRRQVELDESLRGVERLEALAEFAAGAAHELNNPLAVIMGRAQLLMTSQGEKEWNRSLRAIVSQAQRAHRILRDLIYVARPAEPRPRPCQPDAIARQCLEDLRQEAESRSIRLVARIDDAKVLASADPDGLRHLAETLFRNALEASPEGGKITLIARSRTEQLDWAIHNQGQGIDAKASRHLLDPFYCGREAGRGLGLGLSRASRYVTRAGGRLRWQSSPDRGTRFHVTMPLPESSVVRGDSVDNRDLQTGDTGYRVPLAG